MLQTSPDRLFRLAQLRLERADVGDTATWHLGDGGPRVLLVHGFRGDHHGLLGVAGALPEARFVIPDLPGFGKSKQLSTEHSIENYANWLVKFVEQTGEFDAILAPSFGTLVLSRALATGLPASRVLLQNPISTTQRGGPLNSIADRYYELGKAEGSNLLRSQLVVRGMSIALATTLKPSIRRMIHRQHSAHFSTFATNRSVYEGYQAATSSNVLDYARHLPARTFIVAGERDIVAPLAGQREFARITGAELKVIKDTGHLTHYETPAEVASYLAELLER